jgi:BTB/POZ domain-containing protein KCTD9
MVGRKSARSFIKRPKRFVTSRPVKALLVVFSVSILSIWLGNSSAQKPTNKSKFLFQALFENAESIAIVSTAIMFFIEINDRRKRDHYEAWQVISSAANQSGSGGRIQALQDLNDDGISLEGVFSPNADLTGIQLHSGKLNRANFEGSQLNKSVLEEAQLVRANLKGANLSETKLMKANLWQANLEKADLREANLSGATLANTHLEDAFLWEAKLCDADLIEANLTGAKLQGADLQRAHLQGAIFKQANLWNADLRGAQLQGAMLRNADLQKANLSDANLEGADLEDANLSGADLKGARLQCTIMDKTKDITKEQVSEALLYGTILPPHIQLEPDRDRNQFINKI